MTSLEFEILDKSLSKNYDLVEEQKKNEGSSPITRHSDKTLKTALPQILAVSAQNILLLSYGMTLGFPTIAIPALLAGGGDTLTLTKDEISWFSSINMIIVPFGCMASGIITAQIGMKRMMVFVNIPMIVSWILFHYADSVAMLYSSQVLNGLAGGLMEAAVLTYVAEITQPHLRGVLSATATMSVILGVFIQFLMGTLLEWRTVAAVNVCFPGAAFVALCFAPESPYWLVGKDRLADAERALCWLRGWREPSEVNVEFTTLVSSIAMSSKTSQPTATWRNYTNKSFLKPYLVVSMTFFIGHFSGVTPLQTYAVTIFQALGSPVDKYLATFYLGIVQIVTTVLFVFLIHWTGKRSLTLISTIGNGICFIIIATLSHFTKEETDNDVHGWINFLFILLAAFFSHLCIKHLPWIIIGELFPNRVRNFGAGASASIGYVSGFLANKLYIYMVDGMTMAGTFWFYGAVCLLGSVYVYYYLPETEGRTLTEIEEHFEGKISLLKSIRPKCKRNAT